MKKIILPIVLTLNILLANPTLTKLTLETNTTSLNVGDEAKLTVVGRYNNNRTKVTPSLTPPTQY